MLIKRGIGLLNKNCIVNQLDKTSIVAMYNIAVTNEE